MIATITLNPSIDQHVLVRHLVKDDANRAISVESHAGGKGANVSKVVRELGGATHAYTLQAGIIGKFWAESLSRLDVPFTSHIVAGETRINTVLTESEDKTQTRISAPGPVISKKDQRIFLQKMLRARKPDFWVLGGSPSSGMDEDIYKKYIFALQKKGCPCILDADNEALRLGIEAKPFLIKPNEYEMQRLVKKNISTLGDYRSAAQNFIRLGIRVVIVSLGEDGALFVTDKKAFHVAGIPVEVKSRLGAGDSLLGGFALGLLKKRSLEDAAALGVAVSTSTVMREAPRLCRRGDIPALLKRIRIKPVS